jgi:hypothetical protein
VCEESFPLARVAWGDRGPPWPDDQTIVFGADPTRRSLLPQTDHIPDFSIPDPHGLQKKECFGMQPYASRCAMVNPSVRSITQPTRPGVPQE